MSATPNMPALAALASRSIARRTLQADGWRPLHAQEDLHRVGYTVRHWVHLGQGRHLLECYPRMPGSPLPRLTVECYRDQAALHLALGLNLVPPGCDWVDYGQRGLYDADLRRGGGA